jgi:phosphohistidine phosphatase
MIVYLVRHALAFDRDASQWPDDRDRPLTDKGAARFRKVAAVLPKLGLEVDACLSSPLARAWQTAEILNQNAKWPAPEEFPSLEPGATPAEVLKALAHRKEDALALVGHEPNLSQLLAHLLVGAGAAPLGSMKKGGIACLEFGGKPAAGTGSLLWLATPKLILRQA